MSRQLLKYRVLGIGPTYELEHAAPAYTIKEMKNDDDDQTVSLKLTTSFVSQKTFALLFPRIVMRYHEILKNEFHCLCPRPYKKRPRYTYKNARRFFMIIKRLRMTNVMLHYLVVENCVSGEKNWTYIHIFLIQSYLVQLFFVCEDIRKIIKHEN